MNVSLTPELENFVQQQVRGGRYQTASEVVRDALRLLEDEGKLRDAQVRQVKQHIATGVAQADAGDLVPSDVAWKRIRARMEEVVVKKAKRGSAERDAAAQRKRA